MSLRKRSFIVIAIIAVVIIGGSAVFKSVFAKSSKPQQPSYTQMQAWQFQPDKITTDLQGGNMIEVQVTLQALSTGVVTELSSRLSQVDDALNNIMHGLSANELSQPNGLAYLKSLIIQRINSFMTSGKIVKVYINSLIIQ